MEAYGLFKKSLFQRNEVKKKNKSVLNPAFKIIFKIIKNKEKYSNNTEFKEKSLCSKYISIIFSLFLQYILTFILSLA